MLGFSSGKDIFFIDVYLVFLKKHKLQKICCMDWIVANHCFQSFTPGISHFWKLKFLNMHLI